jgi:hypothetical protein
MGYLTKAAGLYRVQIGTNPGQGSVSGVVTNASTGAFLSGVQISLNRGVQTTLTDGNGGYQFASSVVAQTYEVRARKAGFYDKVATVTVAPNMTSTVSFSLTPVP